MTVWKFEIPIGDADFKVSMPIGSTPLHVGSQRFGWLALWAEVNEDVPVETRTFHVVGTGHLLPIACLLQYLGTAIEENGLVWHLYEIGHPE